MNEWVVERCKDFIQKITHKPLLSPSLNVKSLNIMFYFYLSKSTIYNWKISKKKDIFSYVWKSKFVFHHSGLSWSRQHTFSQTHTGKTLNKKGEFVHFTRPNQGVGVLNSHFYFIFLSLYFLLLPFPLTFVDEEIERKIAFSSAFLKIKN